MTILAFLALTLLVGGLVLWRELRRAPLLPPGYDADGQPRPQPHARSSLSAGETTPQSQEAHR